MRVAPCTKGVPRRRASCIMNERKNRTEAGINFIAVNAQILRVYGVVRINMTYILFPSKRRVIKIDSVCIYYTNKELFNFL